jgi:hypothetical protein
MSTLRFLCPLHERDFDGGFEVDDDTFRRHRLKLVVLECPWCNRPHHFLLADGRRTAARQPDKLAVDGPPTTFEHERRWR